MTEHAGYLVRVVARTILRRGIIRPWPSYEQYRVARYLAGETAEFAVFLDCRFT